MSARVAEHDDGVHVILGGTIDLDHSPAARRALLDAVGRGRAISVDLAGVEVLDSSGMASLIEAHALARAAQLGFRLVGASERVMKLLRLARLDQVFELR